MSKIMVKNWQLIHGKDQSSENWVYQALMDKEIDVLPDQSIKIVADGTIGKVGDYLILTPEERKLKIIPKEVFECDYTTPYHESLNERE